jgi:type I restriction enzyme S subunit
MAKLGDYVKIRTGKLDANASSESGQYPFFTCAIEPLKIDSYSYDCECVLVAGNGDLNVKYYSGKFDAYQRTYIIESMDKTFLDVQYLYFFMDKYLETLRSQSIGGVIKYIKLGNLTEADIFIPSIERQREIVQILRKSRELIFLRKQQLAKLDELVKARFVEMFGDFKSNSKGWSIVKFDEFAQIDGNMTTDYKKYADYPHIGIDSIEKGTGALKGYRTVKEDGVVSGKYIFTPQHIIYSKIRPNLNKVALPDFEGLCSADAYPILPNPKNCNRIFLALAMRSDYFLDYILQFSARTNLPKVNRKEIAGFSMPLPPLSLQNDFSTFVERVDQQKQTVQQSLEKLELMKKALMQEYFG